MTHYAQQLRPCFSFYLARFQHVGWQTALELLRVITRIVIRDEVTSLAEFHHLYMFILLDHGYINKNFTWLCTWMGA
jgi:hypothetical protein